MNVDDTGPRGEISELGRPPGLLSMAAWFEDGLNASRYGKLS